jgi:hypothetical protein
VAREWGNIQEEYLKYLEQATSFEIGGTGSEFESYQAAYNALSSYITPLLSNMNVTTTVVRATFNSKFADYYENRGTFLNRLTNEVRAGSAVSIGVDSGGDGFVKVNEYIVDDTALERYWLFGKGGTSYNVKSSSDTLFSVNGGKIIGNSIVTFKAPDNPSVEETPNAGVNVYIAEKDGEKLGLDPNKVRCITTYAGITLLPNNDPVTTRTYSSPILSSGSLTGFRVYAVQSDSIEQFEFSHEEDNLSSSWTDYASVTSTTGSDAVYFYLILFSRKGLWIDISTSFEQTFIRTRDDPVIKKIVVQAKRHDGNQYDARVVFYDSSDAVIGTGTLLNNWVGHDNGHLKILTSAINDNYFISGGSYIDADINTTIIYS